MSNTEPSGWDDLQYPYGVLNIKGGDMPSYPNFVRGNLKLGTSPRPCYASLNMTSEITPFFNSRLEILNVKKFIEDGGITVLDPGKTYVIKMPKLVWNITEYNGLCVAHTDNTAYCNVLQVYRVFREYTYYIRPLSPTRMSLNLEKYDKNEEIKPWPESITDTKFSVTKYQKFSSGNDLSTVAGSDIGISRCYRNLSFKLKNNPNRDAVFSGRYLTPNTYLNVFHDFFRELVTFSESGGYNPPVRTLDLIETPLKLFTEETTLNLDFQGTYTRNYDQKLLRGGCTFYMSIDVSDPAVKNKTKLPHTLTLVCTNKLGGELKIHPVSYLFNSMFKFENVDPSLTHTTTGLVIIPLLNAYY